MSRAWSVTVQRSSRNLSSIASPVHPSSPAISKGDELGGVFEGREMACEHEEEVAEEDEIGVLLVSDTRPILPHIESAIVQSNACELYLL